MTCHQTSDPRSRSLLRTIGALAFLCEANLGFAQSASTPSSPASHLQHFITRDGKKLYDGDKEFRFIGANMPGLVLPYDWTLYLPERLHLPTAWEQEDAFKTLSTQSPTRSN